MEKTDLSLQDCLNKAQRYCAQAEHCEKEVRDKMRSWQVPSEFADDIIDSLLQQKFIDHRRFACAYVHDKCAYNGWGRQKLRYSLRMLGIDEDDMEYALQQIDPALYEQLIVKLLKQKNGQPREKIIRFMLSRGFSYEETAPYL